MDDSTRITSFLEDAPRLSRAEFTASPCPVPAAPGVYGWWFREIPPGVPTDGCVVRDDLTLLYVGISPKAPPTNGRAASSETVRSRIRTHFAGNAEGSTLRLTLGVLLADRLGIELRRVGSGRRLTFTTGEPTLSDWMAEHALVSVIVVEEPWEFERTLIDRLALPLNLAGSAHPFRPALSAMRSQARERARSLPVLPNPGQSQD